MTRTWSLALVCLVANVLISLQPGPALGITIGGWTAARGGDSGILAGGDFAATRNDLAAYFPTVTLAQSSELTSTFLNSIDVLAISPVYGGGSVSSDSVKRRRTIRHDHMGLRRWSRSLLVRISNYYEASQSMIGPFGPEWLSTSNFGVFHGVITDHTSFPAITDGPFGVANTFQGGYDAYFANVAPATPLGTWNDTGGVGLAAMNFGSGKVVFFGSNTFLYGVGFSVDPNNDTLRRNTLTYLLGLAPSFPDYNSNGVVDAADYVVWRKTFGQTGPNLAADGNHNNEIDTNDFALWRTPFRATF